MNNQLWFMTSAFDYLKLEEIIDKAKEVGVQGLDLCVFRRDGTRQDHVATHLDYEDFSPAEASRIIDLFNSHHLKLSIGAFENLIGGDEAERIKNQNHLLKLIRIAHLLGGDENDVKVGTFVGYNHEMGNTEGGFQKNLDEYARIFSPIVKYAEDMGVTILYENCPMEGWRSEGFTGTFNNLPGVLAARKLMYELIPSKAHGEIYDPSHDVWQNIDPAEVIKAMDVTRLHRIHVKATRNLDNTTRTHWGAMYPMQSVNKDLAAKAGIPIAAHSWDRHNYEAMMPGFGGSDSMDWRKFVDVLNGRGFNGPYEMENEAKLSKGTGNEGAIMQGYKASLLFLAPMLWPLSDAGYSYDQSKSTPLKQLERKDLKVVEMRELR
ncbi:sugar phosphate isomerase/epimerase [Imperialibacter roseus]|uniref:Sugar phosphate isomerase/epimerase n=1 Tax=Imperialibacter roseus TaxID=1324217 RepID=A0ABZ0IJU0_9BACT|nr:sugar phosphate isomerase/epimerase [Imperialibacter roseus]WOK05284.1 sugar phosphate isomerase/epimerase [Imperialibacter roseus]